MLRATQTFFVGQRGVRVGDLVDPKDPIVKGREALFEQADAPTRVESASAAPGEKRAVKRLAKTEASKDY